MWCPVWIPVGRERRIGPKIMAGDFIKWQKGLTRKPEVFQIAARLGISRREVAAALMEVWEWADDNVTLLSQTDVTDVTPMSPEDSGFVALPHDALSVINSIVGLQNFAESMTAVGWLAIRHGSLEFPKFGRHNGLHAKRRMLASERQRRSRATKERHTSVTKKRDQRRVEESRGEIKKPPTPFCIPPPLDTPDFRSAWQLWILHRREIKHPLKPTQEAQQIKILERLGPSRSIELIEHTIAMGWRGLRDKDGKDLQALAKCESESRLPTAEEDANWNPVDGGLGVTR